MIDKGIIDTLEALRDEADQLTSIEEAEALLEDAGVNKGQVKELAKEPWPTSLAFVVGYQHQATGEDIDKIHDEIVAEAQAGKTPKEITEHFGLGNLGVEELDNEIMFDEVAFLTGYRFAKERITA